MRFLLLLRLSENSAGEKLFDCNITKIMYWQFLSDLKRVSALILLSSLLSQARPKFFSLIGLGQDRD